MLASEKGRRSQRSGESRGMPRGDVRVGPLRPIPAILAEHGVDPVPVLASVGLQPRLFDDPENRLSFTTLGHLLEACVNATQCRHFGLLVGARSTLDSLGILGQVMRNSPTLRDALRVATLNIEVHDRAASAMTLDLGNSQAGLGYSIFDGETPAADQILDGASAVHVRIFRELCGPSWTPLRIQLSHRRPRSIAPLRQFFGPNLEFDTRISVVVFDSRWLDHRIDGADPAAHAAIVARIASMKAREHAPFASDVRRAIHAMLFSASASTASLANLFNMHERTLRRRLGAEGATVRELVSDVRQELAHHLLRDTTLPISEVAAILRYSDVAVFSRAFRNRSRMSPSGWRAQQAAATGSRSEMR
jgi:AraC-like DNA-binding protein